MSDNTPQQPTTGLHILGELHTNEIRSLEDISLVKDKIVEFIAQADLSQVGMVEHIFPEGGYTFVILLAESHVSIHTWPELGYITLDVFVCNVSRDNSTASRKLFDSIVQLFNPTKVSKREIIR